MQTNPTYSSQAGVDPEELDRRIADMYRDVANELAEDLHFPTERPLAEALGYPADLLALLPAEAVNSFAGVGYQLGLARLLPGERVLDLGSGSGMDVFAAATQVGPTGSVTGVDITPERSPSQSAYAALKTRNSVARGSRSCRSTTTRSTPSSQMASSISRPTSVACSPKRRGYFAGRTARAGRHRDPATDPGSDRVPGGPLGRPASPGPAREIST